VDSVPVDYEVMDRTVGGLVFPLPSSKASEYTSTLSLEDIRRHKHYMCGGGERKEGRTPLYIPGTLYKNR
jgi:hypothetical protein